jgi:FimV-like protein
VPDAVTVRHNRQNIGRECHGKNGAIRVQLVRSPAASMSRGDLSSAPTQTNLELTDAYAEMGDKRAAPDVLEKVLAGADRLQRVPMVRERC